MSSKKKSAKSEADAVAAPASTETKKAKRVRGRARAEVVVAGPQSGKPPTLSPGVKITRTYKGKKITVTCMEGGKFELDGRFFGSLSAIANHVTGGHHSGVAWFGLKARKPARPKGKK
jgi:hypothetical protein